MKYTEVKADPVNTLTILLQNDMKNRDFAIWLLHQKDLHELENYPLDVILN